MTRAILLAVDTDLDQRTALVQDLNQRYSSEYRILEAASPAEALAQLARLGEHNEPVALVLAEQQMPALTGIDLLQHVRTLVPDARRVLILPPAEAGMAIEAVQTAQIHAFLHAPLTPAEERLFPVLDDQLDDWRSGCRSAQGRLRLIGRRWSQRDHLIRNFLTRNHIAYCWFDAACNPEAQALLDQCGLIPEQLPAVVFPDGSFLVQPALETLAERVGLNVRPACGSYDLVVIGAGPAGLAAAVFAASEGLQTLVVEPIAPGGQAGSTSRIENYLGFPSGLTGAELGRRGQSQAARLGAEFLTQHAVGLRTEGNRHIVRLANGCEISTAVVLLTCGLQFRQLNIPGAQALTGRGIYYGASLVEATRCQGEEIFLVGGANSAGQAAIHFARFACRVNLLVRGEGLSATMSKYLIDEIATLPNIRLQPFTEVVEARGAEHLEAIRLRSPEGERWQETTSLFVFIGAEPATQWLPAEILRDADGFILAGPDLSCKGELPGCWPLEREPYLLETSLPGVFVAGDLRHGSIKRIASAVGEGSISVAFAHRYLATL